MPLTASKLRENSYRLLDQMLKTGVHVEIERRRKTHKIILAKIPEKLVKFIAPYREWGKAGSSEKKYRTIFHLSRACSSYTLQ